MRAINPKIFLLIILFFVLNGSYKSQNTFRISYDVDPLYDMPGGILETTTGNYVFGGGLLTGEITEIDPTGVVNWAKIYTNGTTIISDIVHSGTGYTVGGGAGSDVMLMETDAAGTIVWGKTYNPTNGTGASASQIRKLASGDYIIAGSVTGYDPDGSGPIAKQDSNNCYIIKTNSTGTILWDKIIMPTLTFVNDHYLYDVEEVSGGYIFVGSTSEDGTTDNMDALIIKTDANGNLLSSQKFGKPGVSEELMSINKLASGEVIISGYDNNKAMVIRTDANANFTWGYEFVTGLLGTATTEGYNAFETSDGKYACVGTYLDIASFFNGMNGSFPEIGTFLFKIEPSNGSLIFQKFYQNGMSSLMPDGIQASDNGYLLTMMAQETAPLTGFNYHVVKTDPNGNLVANCDYMDLSLSNSGFTPSFTTYTPNIYSGTTSGAFVPAVNPTTPAVGATCCSVADPTTATATPTTICSGSSTVITASGSAPGATYNVYDAATGGTLLGSTPYTASPTSTTTYYIEAASAIGCTSTNRVSVTVTVVTAPTVSVSPTSTTICSGESTTLTATPSGGSGSGYTYSWSNGGTTSSISPSPTANTTYSVTVTDGAGCTSTSASSTVTVTAPPSASISGPTSACNNEMITLTASGGDSYSWNTGQTTASINVVPSTTTTYTVTVGLTGCTVTSQASQTVTANIAPTASVSGNNTICNGASTTLTASGGTSYLWSTTATTTSISVSPTSNTTYTVVATASNGCKDTTQYAVTVNALPTVVANASQSSVCDGGQVTLTGSGATSYTWDNGVTDGVAFTPASTTTYTVTGTDANNCQNTGQVTVTVNPLPTVVANASPSTTVCTGSSVTLTGSGASTYTWDNGVTDGVAFVPATTTTYTVTGTDANTCQNTDQITITVVAPPVATINGSVNGSATVCSNEMTTLTVTPVGGNYSWSTGETTQSINVMPGATTTYTATVTIGSCSDATDYTLTVNTAPTGAVSGTGNNLVCSGTNDTLTASGGTTYLWSTTETTPTIIVAPTANTDYTVVVYDANNCTDTLIYSAAVNPLPTISITGIDTICNGSSTTLSANGGTSYVWNTTETTQSITVSPTLNTSYSVTGSDANGCENTAQYNVVVMAPPSAGITGDSITCAGQPVTLTAVGGSNYVWNTGETTAVISVGPGSSTTYTVVAYVGTCADTATYTVTVASPPNVIVGADTSIIIGQSFVLNASGATQYSWIAPNDGIDPSELNTSNPTASPEQSITYCVVGEQNGCLDTACIYVEVVVDCGEIFVPTAFSPNNDQNNDCLKVYSNCMQSMTFRIYSRWGEVVYETTDIEGCWDGTYKGQLLNTGTFAYTLEYNLIDGSQGVLKGNVSLMK